eukprot:403344400
METANAKYGYVKTMKQWDIYLQPVAEHKYTMIWMHGLGDSANGFLDFFYSSNSIVPNQNTKVVLLNAPSQAVTCNGGMKMNSWYDIMSLGKDIRFDETQVQKSTKRVLSVISQEVADLNNDYSKIFIGGFSQGACMAIHCALSSEHILGGVLALSGHVFPFMLEMIQEDQDGVYENKKKHLKLFAYHGKDDEVIDEGKAHKSYDQLKAAGFENVRFINEDFLGHSVSPLEIAKIKEFLTSNMV